jgi:hypothetical protein
MPRTKLTTGVVRRLFFYLLSPFVLKDYGALEIWFSFFNTYAKVSAVLFLNKGEQDERKGKTWSEGCR